MRKKKLDRLSKVKTSLEELEVLSRLSNSVEFAVLKRLCKRHVDNLKNLSFRLNQTDPNFALKHCDYASQAYALKKVIKLVEESSAKLSKEEK